MSLDTDVEKVVDLLLHDTLTPPRKQTDTPPVDRWGTPATVLKELGNERIDLVLYSENPEEFIKNALSPAKDAIVSITSSPPGFIDG